MQHYKIVIPSYPRVRQICGEGGVGIFRKVGNHTSKDTAHFRRLLILNNLKSLLVKRVLYFYKNFFTYSQ